MNIYEARCQRCRSFARYSLFLDVVRVLTLCTVGIECTLRNARYKSIFGVQVMHVRVKLDVNIM